MECKICGRPSRGEAFDLCWTCSDMFKRFSRNYEWRIKNPEVWRKQKKRYYEKNKDKIIEYEKEYRKNKWLEITEKRWKKNNVGILDDNFR